MGWYLPHLTFLFFFLRDLKSTREPRESRARGEPHQGRGTYGMRHQRRTCVVSTLLMARRVINQHPFTCVLSGYARQQQLLGSNCAMMTLMRAPRATVCVLRRGNGRR